MPAATKRRARGDFARELQRHAAIRGRIDPVYRELSDHWTSIYQRLYPVWILIAPGLSSPGHIELKSRTVYLDSEELLGELGDIAAGRLERRAILRCFGVAAHETFHAKHTKVWVSERDVELAKTDRLLVRDRRLLEEPRMEAHGFRDHGAATRRGRFLHAAVRIAVADCILPPMAAQLAVGGMLGGVSRDLAGFTMAYLKARAAYGGIEPAAIAPLEPVWEAALGADDKHRLEDLFGRLVWCPDGDSDALTHYAREYRDIIGEEDPQLTAALGGESGDATTGPGEGADAETDAEVGGQSDDRPGKSVSEALAEAIEAAQQTAGEAADQDATVTEQADRANPRGPGGRGGRSAGRGNGSGVGAASGRLPDRGVDRPPFSDEVQQARKFAHALAKARTIGRRVITKRTPGGRFNARSWMRGKGECASGAPARSTPWEITLERRARLEDPHVAVIVDTSGSMGGYEYALGPVTWTLHEGLRLVGGRMAVSLFGNGSALLTDGKRPMPLVPGIKTGGGTQHADDALTLACDQLDMANRSRPRFIYCLSDGGWYDTEAGVQRIRELAEQCVPTIHVSIGIEPLSVEADRIVVITDPADAFEVIANDTIEALRAAKTCR